MSRPVLVFDVNETLLDIAPLEPLFKKWFGDIGVMRRWFGQLVLYSQALTLAGRYQSFGSIGADVLAMQAKIEGATLPAQASHKLASAISTLPAHRDVVGGLSILRDAGFRLATLTNSDTKTQEQQLTNAGIATFFEAQISVDAVGQFKPALATYRYAASHLGIDASEMTMIACHPWDLLGARAAGCRTVFLQRPGNSQPDFASDEIQEISEVGELSDLISGMNGQF